MYDYMFHVPGPATAVAGRADQPLYRLSVIDCRTGRLLHLGGAPFYVYSRNPARSRAELMQGRDPLTYMVASERVEDWEVPA